MSNGPLVSFRFPFRFGSTHDPIGKEGLASITANLMAKGATRSRSYKQILDAFFEMATQFEVQVDQELTVFTGVVHRDHLARYQDIVREMLDAPAFLEEDLDRVRAEHLNALRVELRGSNDEELAKEVLYSRLLKTHPCIGTVRGLQSISIADVRRCFLAMAAAQPPLLSPMHAPRGVEAILIEKPAARGVAMSLGHPIEVIRGHQDYPALLVAQCWLGQHRNGGRLFDSIRETRGLNYGDYAYLEYFPRGMYQFEPDPNLARHRQIFHVWLRPVEPSKATFALRLALHEMGRLQREGMTEEDFDRARNFLSKYVKLLIKTDSIRQGYALDSEFYGIGEYTHYIAEGLAKLTVEDVNRAARQHLSVEDLCLVAVGPDMTSFARELQSDSISPISYEVEPTDEVLRVDRMVAASRLPVTKIEVLPFEQVFET